MRKHLVLVGGGHAHMVTLENMGRFVEKGYKVTVIAPSFYHYYSGMGPGMLGGSYTPDQIRFATKRGVEKQGGVFVKDWVSHIHGDKNQVMTRSGHVFTYDVLSVNVGSYVPMDAAEKDPGMIYPVKPIEKLAQASEQLKRLFQEKSCTISVVGGGPSSAEVAGNVWQLAQATGGYPPQIRIFAGKKFMARFAEPIRQRVLKVFHQRKIELIQAGYVQAVTQNRIVLETGESFDTDFIFMALGVKPSTLFQASGLPIGPDQGLRVNDYLQSVAYPNIFGGGDCIYFENQPLDKVGVYAVRQNPVLFHNLMASLEGTELQAFDPGPDYLLIFNLGGGKGLLKKNRVVFGGRIAFWIKDYIDRRFIEKFQASEKTP